MNTMGFDTAHLRITEEQRDRAEHWLQEAYADGRLDAAEFDERLGHVLQARTRTELNRAFYGLADRQRPWTGTVVPHSAPNLPARQDGTEALAGAAHLSPLVSSFVGPTITLAVSPRGSFARRQSAEALNFQLLSLLALIAFAVIDPLNWLILPVTIGWFVFTIYGGIKALQGIEFRNPVLQLTKFRPVKP